MTPNYLYRKQLAVLHVPCSYDLPDTDKDAGQSFTANIAQLPHLEQGGLRTCLQRSQSTDAVILVLDKAMCVSLIRRRDLVLWDKATV